MLAAAALLPATLLTGTTAYAVESPTPSLTATATPASGSPSASASEPAPESTSPTQSPSVAVSASAPPSFVWDECDGDNEDRSLRPTLFLPEGITAGSGWHDFTFRVENLTDTAFEDLDIFLDKIAYSSAILEGSMDDSPEETSAHLDVQLQNPKTHVWEGVPFLDSDIYGRIAWTGIAPRETLTFELRLRIDESIPLWSKIDPDDHTGIGHFVVFVKRPDENGECTWSRVSDSYLIHEAGTDTGDGNASTPPSDALPLLALAGGVAVAVCGGTVYAVRRRRAGEGRL
ncbi:hypothetical protein [Streptomyces shaanxiensis]|uniref:hypothetical protein n=1 Tax=Streptomyces shaanxiensis TaxID=653357 RepID=UPI0031EDC266